jgi:hypothetical protein
MNFGFRTWSIFLKCNKWNIDDLLKIFVRGGRVVRICCLMLHMILTKFLNYVIVDSHFYCGLSRWSGNNQ